MPKGVLACGGECCKRDDSECNLQVLYDLRIPNNKTSPEKLRMVCVFSLEAPKLSWVLQCSQLCDEFFNLHAAASNVFERYLFHISQCQFPVLLIHVGPISLISKTLLNGSSSLSGAHLFRHFQNCVFLEF